MKRLRALADEARAAGEIKYAELLEQQALRAAAGPDGSRSNNSSRGLQNAEALEKSELATKKGTAAFLANGISSTSRAGAPCDRSSGCGSTVANSIRASKRLLIETSDDCLLTARGARCRAHPHCVVKKH